MGFHAVLTTVPSAVPPPASVGQRQHLKGKLMSWTHPVAVYKASIEWQREGTDFTAPSKLPIIPTEKAKHYKIAQGSLKCTGLALRFLEEITSN